MNVVPRRRLLLLALLTCAVTLVVATTAGAYHTQFVNTYCNYGAPEALSYFTRQNSSDYAYTGTHEGYQWGGGCWNNDNYDNSPNDPTEDPNTGGEGGDCSGFTFKSWFEADYWTDKGGYRWNKFRNIHGPYDAYGFKSGYGGPNVTYAKSGLIRMDALASDTHVGMIYAKNADGTDQIVEAKGEAYGTNIWTRTYRSNVNYGGVRRLGWSA
jgi:hypothetical protein